MLDAAWLQMLEELIDYCVLKVESQHKFFSKILSCKEFNLFDTFYFFRILKLTSIYIERMW